LLNPGNHSLHWDLKNDKGIPVAGGTYLYRLTANNGVKTGKLTVIR
jgi:flagellar hook assembly protein FlgD